MYDILSQRLLFFYAFFLHLCIKLCKKKKKKVIIPFTATLNHKQMRVATIGIQMTDFMRSTWRQQAREGGRSRACVCACAVPDAAALPIITADVPLPPSFSCHCVFREEEEEEEESRFLSFFFTENKRFRHTGDIFFVSLRCSTDAGYFSPTATAPQPDRMRGAKGGLGWEEGPETDWEAAHPPLSLIQPQFAVYFHPTAHFLRLSVSLMVSDGSCFCFRGRFFAGATFFLTFVTQKNHIS